MHLDELANQGKFIESQNEKSIPTQKSLRMMFSVMGRQSCLF